MDWAAGATELLWIGGLTALPLALVVVLASRWPGCRPATRHAMWAAVLVSFLTPAVATLVWRPTWFSSGKLLAAAGTALERIREELRFEEAMTPPPPPSARASATEPTNKGHLAPLAAKEPVTSMKKGAGAAGSEKSKKSEASGTKPAVNKDAKPASDKSAKRSDKASNGEAKRSTEESKRAGTRNDPDNGGRAAPSSAVAPGSESAAAPGVTTAPSAAQEEPAWTAEVKSWVAQVVNVRDALAALPPLPMEIWGSGIAVLLAAWGVKMIGVRRALRHARPATGGTKEQVEEAARELGMRRAPRTLVTGSRVSPMVLCGLRPTLVLPTGLWRELDAGSRRAVLLHELAHLRRRDHWLSWLASLVGLVYWWHPVAWWARRRVRDEADAACDAWVTSLMPASRRCYAEALVTTKWFLSCPGRRVPSGLVGVGTLGVMTGRTKHLARRLKMVMTQRVAPRSSLAGALVALGVMAAGMFVVPSLACPPEETAKAEASKALAKAEAAKVKDRAKAEKMSAEKAEKSAKAGGKNVEFFGEAPALEAMRRAEAAKQAEKAGGDREDAIMRRLEERMRRLEEQIRELERNRGGATGGPRSMNVPPTPAAPKMRAPGALAATAPSGGPRGPVVAVGPMAGTGATTAVAPRAPRAVSVPATPATPRGAAVAARTPQPAGMSESGEEVTREYRLPEGKLEALTELMARQDVPVMIERHPDKIVVHAPESKQKVFAAFVRLINPESSIPTGALPRTTKVESKMKVEQEQKAKELRSKMKEVEKQHRDAEKAADKARQRSDSTHEQMDAIHEQIDALHERIHGDAGEAEKGKLEAEIAKLTARMQERTEEIAKYISEATAKEAILEALEETLGQLESEMESLDEEMNNCDETDVIEIEIEIPGCPEEGEAPAATPEPACTEVPVAVPVPSAAPMTPTAAVPQPTPAPSAPVGVVPAVAPPAPPASPAPAAPPAAPAPVRA